MSTIGKRLQVVAFFCFQNLLGGCVRLLNSFFSISM